ncbi:MAG: MATE family efflux transporter [Brevundimonas sp.]|uniref:MATE family efflux transporter n=1 Tax=Brevundimonas sp. TaxID=1871086 RepID=UPI00391DBB8A
MVTLSRQTRSTLKDLLHLAWPVVLARIGIMTMGLTDAIVVGRWSGLELAYSSLAMTPTMIVVTTALGLLMGVQVMTARFLGEGRRHEVGAVLRRGVSYSLLLGFGSMIALILLGPWALRSLGLADGLAEGASPVLIILALSMPGYLVSVAAQLFLEALHRPRAGMWAMWVANGVNLALNLLLVPDVLGLGFDGAAAAAWATLFARTSLAVFLIVYIVRMPEARSLGVFNRPRRDPVAERDQRKVGYGAGSSYFIEVAAFGAMTFIAGQLGAIETAAWTIVLNVSAVVFMAPMGLSSATAVLVGQAYGAKDGRGVMRAGLVGIGVVSVLTLTVALVLWPTAPWVASAYNRDPALLAVVVPALVLATLFFVADGIQVVSASANRAAGDVWWPTIMHFGAYSLIMMPLGWWLAHEIGVNGLVWAVIIASLVSSALLTGRFVRVAKRLPV